MAMLVSANACLECSGFRSFPLAETVDVSRMSPKCLPPATTVKAGLDWLHELNFDGSRMTGGVRHMPKDIIELFTVEGLVASDRFVHRALQDFRYVEGMNAAQIVQQVEDSQATSTLSRHFARYWDGLQGRVQDFPMHAEPQICGPTA